MGSTRIIIIVLSALLLGVVGGLSVEKGPTWISSLLSRAFISDSPLYETNKSKASTDTVYQQLRWSDLLPDAEALALQTAKVDESAPLHQQIFQSIQTTFDDRYQDAMKSSNTVDAWNDKSISIHGFIVPLEIDEHKQIMSFFIVPYFGACIHYPPPPPNQIIYARVSEGLSNIDINSAYTFSGHLNQGLFEDPQGTSAYLLDVVKIMPYHRNSKSGSELKSGTFHLDTSPRGTARQQ